MDHSDPAPDEVKSTPPSGTLLPKHKGMALIFIFCAELYPNILHSFLPVYQQTLMVMAPYGASDALRKIFGIDIGGTSIERYYNKVKYEARRVLKWDKHALAHIIRSQVSDEATYEEVVEFLAKNRRVSPTVFSSSHTTDYWIKDIRLERGTRWLMKEALRALEAADFPFYSAANKFSSVFDVEDPVLQQEESVTGNEDDDDREGARALETSPPGSSFRWLPEKIRRL